MEDDGLSLVGKLDTVSRSGLLRAEVRAIVTPLNLLAVLL